MESSAAEYKDVPVRFTFILDGRQEPVRATEPEVDVPFPVKGRLLVREGDAVLSDVVFRFDRHRRQPYELHFRTIGGRPCDPVRVFSFGLPFEQDRDLLEVYRKTILDRGGVKAET